MVQSPLFARWLAASALCFIGCAGASSPELPDSEEDGATPQELAAPDNPRRKRVKGYHEGVDRTEVVHVSAPADEWTMFTNGIPLELKQHVLRFLPAEVLRSTALIAPVLKRRWMLSDAKIRREVFTIGIEGCGPKHNKRCDESILVPGGQFNRNNAPQYPATVSAFRLDKYPITVGQMRKFVKAAIATGYRPAAGSGKHTHLNGGLGLETEASTPGQPAYESGWDSAWDEHVLQGGAASLECHAATWTDEVSGFDRYAQNCLNWYTAYAYCIATGGFLPTEAELNFVAAGGAQQREYPWSDPTESAEVQMQALDCSYANYFGCGGRVEDVQSKSPKGDGRWGHVGLTGNVSAWALDTYVVVPTGSGNNQVNTSAAPNRSVVGGNHGLQPDRLLLRQRRYEYPPMPTPFNGARCARRPIAP